MSTRRHRSQALFELESSDDSYSSLDKPRKLVDTSTFPRGKSGLSSTQRRNSIDSLLSDSSSGSLEELFRKASITQKLLAKPQVELNLEGFESSQSISSKEDEIVNDDVANSAWYQQEKEGDYALSKTKCPQTNWPNVLLPSSLYESLFDFQRQGVQWLASLHMAGIGGILADDMGLGKTWTSLSLLCGLMRSNTIQTALIIAPLSVLRSWETTGHKILRQCVTSFKVTVLNSDVSRQRRLQLIRSLKTKDRGGRFVSYDIVITTYGLIRSAVNDFISHSKTIWDYVVLDEGHQIKNHNAEVSKACRMVCSPETRRIVLTGTPIMNNLKELWSLFDFATSGKILGTLKTFNQYYAKHIEAARDRLATDGVIQLGQRKNEELQNLIRPYFLQRLKRDYLKDKLPTKHDIVVWTHLSHEQRELYTDFVNSKDSIVRSILTGAVTSPLEAITWLKKLCGHPLLTKATGVQMERVLQGRDASDILHQSRKLQVLVKLVMHLCKKGHRMLIFSQSTKMLDTIMIVLRSRIRLTRIDGSTPEKDRQYLVDDFNRKDSRVDAMLLSTKAAGCGLTLIGADTSIIYDPAWTPAEDSQAVDRCYRIGQTKEVTVYRLIAAGTVEEKVYEKQVFKDGIRHAVLSRGQNVERHFERHELSALFNLGEPGVCRVMEKLPCTIDLDRYEFLYDMDGVVGITPHDGFYHDDDGAKKMAFDGSFGNVASKILGRSQRVLCSHSNNHAKEYVAVGKAANTRQRINQKRVPRDSNDQQAPGKSMPMQPINSFHRNPSNSDIVEEMLTAVSKHLHLQHHRKALEILLDLVESGMLQGEKKLRVHQQIADIAQTLDLL